MITFFFIHYLTGGNYLGLFSSGFTNSLKWKRLTDPDIIVIILEAVVNGLMILSASIVFSYTKPNRFIFLILFVGTYLLYFLSTGSRSPIVGFFLTIVPLVFYSKSITLRMKRIFLYGAFLSVIVLFALVTFTRAEIEQLNVSSIYPIFVVDKFLLYDLFEIFGRTLSLVFSTIVIYLGSTFNNFNIIVDNFEATTAITGPRTLYPFTYTLKAIGIAPESITANLDDVDRVRGVLRSVSPTGDQWAGSVGHAVLDFGYFSVFFWIMQSLFVGILANTVRHSEPIFKALLASILFPTTIFSALVHPLNSIQTYIILLIYVCFIFFHKIKFPKRFR